MDPERIVVLCANSSDRHTAVYWLTLAGVPFEIADDGYGARKFILRQASTVLITDRVLPPWPGLGRFSSLKRRRKGLRVAYVDSEISNDSKVALAAGADLIVQAPLSRGAILNAIALSAAA